MTFAPSLKLPQLGCGAGYALWGFRAAVIGHADCCALTRGYDRLFGERSGIARGTILIFARLLGSIGKRRISLGAPGCCSITCDELSIIASLAAAQTKDGDLRDAHLLWLLGGAATTPVAEAADAIAEQFQSVGLSINQPSIKLDVAAMH